MKKLKTRQIIVIGTIIMRKAHYVRVYRKRMDGQYQIELTTNLREAQEFDSQPDAHAVCNKIFNPYEREFVVEETLVDWKKTKTDIIAGELE